MRAADRREVMAGHGLGPEDALRISLGASRSAWTLLAHDRPLAMGGVVPADDGSGLTGRPWLLGTPEAETAPLVLARVTRRQVGVMLGLFPRLENWCHADNALSLRWLRWCGFVIDDAPEEINGEYFYRFLRVAKCVNR